MKNETIKFTIFNDEDEEITHELPAVMAVCSRCEGRGRHLNPNIGQHAYTAEEFYESFDDEEAEEYMKGGDGIYGVPCEKCDGLRVVPVVDRTRSDKALLKLYDAWVKDENEYQAMARSEDRMQRAMGGDW